MGPRTVALATVYCVTYRRPQLLKRALQSICDQAEQRWRCRVVNDDPDDGRVAGIIASLGDARISLFEPVQHRGGAANFNLAFRESETPFASILEDDNWWEPAFLATMLQALERHQDVQVACCNERVWRECADGGWEDTHRTIWERRGGTSMSTLPFDTACGSALLCNSAMLFRTGQSRCWATPDDIPVDVTEHVRDRLVPQPILLVHEPLVNFSETLSTFRSNGGRVWGDYQAMLIASCFHAVEPALRPGKAQLLWRQAGTKNTARGAALLFAGLAFSEAAALWHTAPFRQVVRFLVTLVARPGTFFQARSTRRRYHAQWAFLCATPYCQRLREADR